MLELNTVSKILAGATALLTHVDREINGIDARYSQCNGDILGLVGCQVSYWTIKSSDASRHTFSGSFTKVSTISDVHPSTIRQKATTRDPKTMNGLRRPHFDRDRSAITPIRGWIINPDKGPAIQTNEVLDLVNPSCRRYGVQSNQEYLALASNSSNMGDWFKGALTSHLRAPCEPVSHRSCQPLSIYKHSFVCSPATSRSVRTAIRPD